MADHQLLCIHRVRLDCDCDACKQDIDRIFGVPMGIRLLRKETVAQVQMEHDTLSAIRHVVKEFPR